MLNIKFHKERDGWTDNVQSVWDLDTVLTFLD